MTGRPDQPEAARFESPPAIRSLLMLEAAASMVRGRKRPSFGTQVEISIRPQGDNRWHARFLASDTPEGIDAVVEREADLAIINPSALLTLAYRGSGAFRRPAPVRAVTVLPQFDFLMFAVPADSGLQFVEELAEGRHPLKISVRGREPNHSVHAVMSDVLAAAGCPLADLESAGSQIFHDAGMASGPNRLGAVATGERTAIFDEAWPIWGTKALEQGMTFLSLREDTLDRLRAMGYRTMTITPEVAPGLGRDVEVVDFSGWPVFCHAEADDDFIERFCAALDEQRDVIPWDGPGPLPLERMCGTHPDAPLDVPLHPAARRYWEAKGYL
ncbi:hypothetical protein [Nocardioides sp. LHG3406-4]|uniref:hypothetical protein n=1 Tax=Nocardioides sp. LHG3406-4 TaxID=2804575 RepID=UPI003CF62734